MLAIGDLVDGGVCHGNHPSYLYSDHYELKLFTLLPILNGYVSMLQST